MTAMARTLSFWRLTVLLTAILFFARPGAAHTTGLSTSELDLNTNGVRAELILAGADFLFALARFDATNTSDLHHDGKLSAEKLSAGINGIRKFATECLAVEFDGHPAQPSMPGLQLDDKDN